MNLVRVVGTGHHDRATFAAALIPRLADGGFQVTVRADLRPRLAADLSSMLEAGADMVRMEGSGVAALVVTEAQAPRLDAVHPTPGPAVVEVVLIAGTGEVRAEIVEAEDDQTRILLAGLVG